MVIKNKAIRGAGGGDKEADATLVVSSGAFPHNVLQSGTYARVIDLLCEGEIEGLVDGLNSIYLDGIPVRNDDFTYNFNGVTAYPLVGTQAQTYIPGIDAAETPTAVDQEVLNGTPVSFPVSGTAGAVNAVRVLIEVTQLGKLHPLTQEVEAAKVEIAIDVDDNGGGFVEQDLGGLEEFAGRTASPYQRVFRLQLSGNGPWTVRVRRISPDSSSSYLAPTWVRSYSTVTDEKLNYPNSALVAIQVSAEQFKNIPTRGYHIRGLKIKVPSNYNPLNRTYDGIWDGTFQVAWTDNPAWVFYDLLTTARYGLGNYINEAAVDKWGLYEIAQYCDAKVRRGDRFLDGTRDVYDIIPQFNPGNLTFIASTSVGTGLHLLQAIWSDSGNSDPWLAMGLVEGMEVKISGCVDESNNGNFMVETIDGINIHFGPTDGHDDIPLGVNDTYTDGLTMFESVDRTEPRFRANVYLQTQEDAYSVINSIASIFRAMVYWSSGTVMVSQDAPKDAEYLFTASNVVDGMFNYTSSARRARHTVAVVQWNDPENHYKALKEFVSDEESMERYGYNETDVIALGCTSRGQAQRLGRWVLYSERYEKETVTFRTGIEGALRNPGAVIKVQDPYRSGKRFGGRIVEATTDGVNDFIELDKEVNITSDGTLHIIGQDGVVASTSIIGTGMMKKLKIALGAVSPLPVDGAVFVVEDSTLVPVSYRVLNVSEVENGVYEITALRHEDQKYDAVENDTKIESFPYSTLLSPTNQAPENLVIGESLYFELSSIKVIITANWDAVADAQQYLVRWRKVSEVDVGNWHDPVKVHVNYWEMRNITPGLYEVEVAAVMFGITSQWTNGSYEVLGKTAAPSDVTGFSANLNGNTATLQWDEIPDLDRDTYEVRFGGTNWTDAIVLGKVKGTQMELWFSPDTHTLRIKAIDTSGNYSTNETTTVLITSPTKPSSITLTITSSPPANWP